MVRACTICAILLSLCALPALAQAPATYNITCSSGTACKTGTVPLFTTTGGASKVDSSIVSQSGSTVTVAGSVSAKTSYEIGGAPFAFGSVTNTNAFLGFAGNSTTTGTGNIGVGTSALSAVTTGDNNTAVGTSALSASTTGSGSSAFGWFALAVNTSGTQNQAFGTAALFSNTAGSSNSAFGLAALYTNTTGNNNSAFGYGSLHANTIGTQNEGFGYEALFANTTGNGNAAFGTGALYKNTTGGSSTTTGGNSAFGNFALLANTIAGGNSAFGFSALTANTAGNNNVAVGAAALAELTTGSGNIAIGTGAGGNLNAGESNDIYIGDSGIAGESNTIRIGYIGTITSAYIAGIDKKTSSNGTEVFVNATGQLGTIKSSLRYKHEIADMSNESDILMKLRPVAFYYKPELDDTQTRQYGLVAEEVAKVAPELVVFNEDGTPETVRYHFVNAMLLNEVQKQRQRIEDQQKTNEQQNNTIVRQQEQIQDLAARMAKLETLLAAKP
ncbi:MAG TPA: tail fiber domain-containing protein [Terriglobales bacterium]|nr:tail fiber domain-containing protein [Terriglobales bacterium]